MHHRAALLQLLDLVETMTRDQQVLIARLAELLANKTDERTVVAIISLVCSALVSVS